MLEALERENLESFERDERAQVRCGMKGEWGTYL